MTSRIFNRRTFENPLGIPQGYTLKTMQVFTSTGANTWTRPAGCRAVEYFCTGGGGGAMGGRDAASNGGGGGGGTAIEFLDEHALQQIDEVTATVGTGGAGGATGGGAATAGTASSFGSFCTANGGAVGAEAGPGAGGTATGGTTNHKGGIGQGGYNYSPSPRGGCGGSTIWGSGGMTGFISSPAGVDAKVFGAGGGGPWDQATAAAGGAGKSGVIVVMEYY